MSTRPNRFLILVGCLFVSLWSSGGLGQTPEKASQSLMDATLGRPANFNHTLNQIFRYERELSKAGSADEIFSLYQTLAYVEHNLIERSVQNALDLSPKHLLSLKEFEEYYAERTYAGKSSPLISYAAPPSDTEVEIEVDDLQALLESIVVEDGCGDPRVAWNLVRSQIRKIVLWPRESMPKLNVPQKYETWRTWRYGHLFFLRGHVAFPLLASLSKDQQLAWLAGALVHHAVNSDVMECQGTKAEDYPVGLLVGASESRALRSQAIALRDIFQKGPQYVSEPSVTAYLRALMGLRALDTAFRTENHDLTKFADFDLFTEELQFERAYTQVGRRNGHAAPAQAPICQGEGLIRHVEKNLYLEFYLENDPVAEGICFFKSEMYSYEFLGPTLITFGETLGFLSPEDVETLRSFWIPMFLSFKPSAEAIPALLATIESDAFVALATAVFSDFTKTGSLPKKIRSLTPTERALLIQRGQSHLEYRIGAAPEDMVELFPSWPDPGEEAKSLRKAGGLKNYFTQLRSYHFPFPEPYYRVILEINQEWAEYDELQRQVYFFEFESLAELNSAQQKLENDGREIRDRGRRKLKEALKNPKYRKEFEAALRQERQVLDAFEISFGLLDVFLQRYPKLLEKPSGTFL